MTLSTASILFIIGVLIVAALVLYRWLGGASLAHYDRGYPKPIAGDPPSRELHSALQAVEAFTAASGGGRLSPDKVRRLRAAMDNIGADKACASIIRSSAADEPRGEWVLAANANPDCRLLYIHGGGFIAGSPTSHRAVTDGLSELTGMAVFSLDYRLVPENARLAGLEDAVAALQWLGHNGPDGASDARTLAVAGDSAGGNLTLATLQEARKRGIRNADAAVAICPATDMTLEAPSLRYNIDSDAMLGKSFGPLAKTPAAVRHVVLGVAGKRPPKDPAMSPLRGDLSGLPPVLLQASTTEMLLDDSARYHHKALEEGADVEFETYANMPHVWHLFYPELPEARIALQHIADFLARKGCCALQSEPPAGAVA